MRINLDRMALVAISDLGGEASTNEIRNYMERHEIMQITIGKLWLILDRLEAVGDIASEQRPGGVERGNKPKRVCRLTGHGLAKLKG